MLSLLGLVGLHLNLNKHIRERKARDRELRVQRPVVWYPLTQLRQEVIIRGLHGDGVGPDQVDVFPAPQARGAEDIVDVLEGQVDLALHVGGVQRARLGPAALA